MKTYEVFIEFDKLVLKTFVTAESFEGALDEVEGVTPWNFLNECSSWEGGDVGRIVGVTEIEEEANDEVSAIGEN